MLPPVQVKGYFDGGPTLVQALSGHARFTLFFFSEWLCEVWHSTGFSGQTLLLIPGQPVLSVWQEILSHPLPALFISHVDKYAGTKLKQQKDKVTVHSMSFLPPSLPIGWMWGHRDQCTYSAHSAKRRKAGIHLWHFNLNSNDRFWHTRLGLSDAFIGRER